MSIFDGFKLWLGKAFAEIAIFVGIIALIAIAIFLNLVWQMARAWWRERFQDNG